MFSYLSTKAVAACLFFSNDSFVAFSLFSPISTLHVRAHRHSALSHDRHAAFGNASEFGCETLETTWNIPRLIPPRRMRKMLHGGIFGAGRDEVDVFPLIHNDPLMTKPNARVYYLSEAAFSFRSQSFWLSEKPCLPLLKELGPAEVGVSLEDESAVNARKGILIIAVNQSIVTVLKGQFIHNRYSTHLLSWM